MSACLVLAWCILPLAAVAGLSGPGHLVAQPSTGTAVSSTAASAAATTRAVLAGASAPAAATGVTAARPAARPAAAWTVRPGDTLSAIAAGLGVRGGWPALYAANRAAVGPDPGLIRPGTVLAVPGHRALARYTVAPGDTLSAVAAALGVRGGWPALYAANQTLIGPDPGLIRAGTVLAVPRPAAPAAPATAHPAPRAPAPGPARQAPAPAGSHPAQQSPAPPGSRSAAPGHAAASGPAAASGSPAANGRRAAPGRPAADAPAGGLPRWLQDVLLAAGVLAATAFAAEPAAALARRRRGTARPGRTRPRPRAPDGAGGAGGAGVAGVGGGLGGPGAARGARRAARKAKIVLADHERLIVTYSAADHAVYVLTPPGEDPRAVLRAARLVVPEDTYQDLAGHLGVPPGWPLE
jgi:LysM repeat protein